MDWITRKQVKKAASEGLESALKSSQLHWKQLSTATIDELMQLLKDDADKHRSVVMSSYCALCEIDEINCGKCIAAKPDSSLSIDCCNELWQKTVEAWNHTMIADGTFTKRAKDIYDFLMNLKT